MALLVAGRSGHDGDLGRAGGCRPPGDDNPSPRDDLDRYPLAAGLYEGVYGSLTPQTPNFWGYWLYFKTPGGWSCGLAPNGGPIGCDMVPADAPPGTNQTFADAAHPAGYRQSNTATFTRDVPVLPAGQRVQTVGASCAIDDTGAVHCQTEGNHGFILSASHGVLW
ncbi:hypothetical protein BZL29_2653 [Mycobacterium kansasii]|uniref:Uncharacterized protein n=1 Tax=Mycobacterium kansasii TaxID=1768 RepID=A0A1V3XP17_MYCKA|nr:hypothetical protein BZL29_2653 [Mycobacterium kansasii]